VNASGRSDRIRTCRTITGLFRPWTDLDFTVFFNRWENPLFFGSGKEKKRKNTPATRGLGPIFLTGSRPARAFGGFADRRIVGDHCR